MSGETLELVLQNPLARDYFLREWLLALPDWLLQGVTHAILVVELLFAPLALSKRLRPTLWSLMLLVQLGFLSLLNFADLTLPMLLMHILTFDPGWVPAKQTSGREIVHYDGNCGLCHRVVRFALAEDRLMQFDFAPLQTAGERMQAVSTGRGRESFVVSTGSGRVLTASRAVRHLASRMGGLWRVAGLLFGILPQAFQDYSYYVVGRHRLRIFGRTETLCPVVSQALRSRFRACVPVSMPD